ncbi:6PF2K domain-containing protein [Favolaschia claudopus]|uniref:6PF2K domain-containing protein n=1 Tax=Favolaschia claudopus TaxID=2862362 RepID=A0AAW0E6M6_9AGAR
MLTDVIIYFKNPSSSASHSPESMITVSPGEKNGPLSHNQINHPPPYSVHDASPLPAATLPRGPNPDLSGAEWKAKLKKLEKKIRKFNWKAGKRAGDEAAIVEGMRDLAASHYDPHVQAYWNHRADEFEKAPESDKKAILADIGRALVSSITVQFTIAGALLVGTGMLFIAGGNMLTSVGKSSIIAKQS